LVWISSQGSNRFPQLGKDERGDELLKLFLLKIHNQDSEQ